MYRFALFKEILGRYFAQNSGQLEVPFDIIQQEVNAGLTGDEAFTFMETEAALVEMSNENKIMYSSGIVYLI